MSRRYDVQLDMEAGPTHGDPFAEAGNMNPFGLLTHMGPDRNGHFRTPQYNASPYLTGTHMACRQE